MKVGPIAGQEDTQWFGSISDQDRARLLGNKSFRDTIHLHFGWEPVAFTMFFCVRVVCLGLVRGGRPALGCGNE